MSNRKTSSIKKWALAGVGALALAHGGALAQSKIEFDIDPKPLGDALNEFGMQSGEEILFVETDTRGKRTNGVEGMYKADDALDILLTGSGIDYRVNKLGTFLVGTVAARRAAADGVRIQLASLQDGERQSDESVAAMGDRADVSGEEPPDVIVVTGTNILGSGPIGSKLVSVDRQEIDSSGFSSIQEIVQSIPQNSQSGAVSNFGAAATSRGLNTTLGTGINLRGLGARSSLVLVNGRRLAPGALGTFVDISTIPLSAVERVEVLADGASAIYGSDAVVGVVNILLRDDYEGAQTSFGYRGTTEGGGREYQVSQLLGANWNSGNITLGYEFTDRNSIQNSQRRATSNCDFTDRGGDDFCSLQSNPGNITRIGGMPASLAIPPGQDGASLSETDLISGALNTFNDRLFVDLLPAEERHSGFVRFSQGIGDNVEFFAEGFYGRRESLYASRRAGVNLSVPETNAFRQLNGLFPGQGNVTVAYNLTPDLGPVQIDALSEGWSFTSGLNIDISRNWILEVFGSAAHQNDRAFLLNGTDNASLNQALASADLSTSFNPFADGSNSEQSVLDRIAGAVVDQDLNSELKNFGARLNGELIDLPAGPVLMAAGLEYREEEVSYRQLTFDAGNNLTDDFPGPLQSPFDRNIKTVFAEISVPVFGSENAVRGFEDLHFTAALRVEEYSDFGTTTNPKFGASWTPFNSLTIRGTYGTSFSVSRFNDTLSPVTAAAVTLPGFLDPRATDGSTNLLVIGGGNPNLGPENGETFTVGALIEPSFLPGLSFDLSYFDVSIEDAIDRVTDIRVAFANEDAFAGTGLVIRDPSVQQVQDALAVADILRTPVNDPSAIELIIFSIPLNTGVLKARGLDFEVAYSAETGAGDFGLTVRGSYLLELSQSPAPGIEPFRNEGQVLFPSKFSGRATGLWSNGPWSLSTSVNYVAPYEDGLSSPARDIGSWTTVDAQIAFRIGDEGERGWGLDGLEVALSATNLFNAEPPFVNNLTGIAYDQANANPLGRQLGVRLTKDW